MKRFHVHVGVDDLDIGRCLNVAGSDRTGTTLVETQRNGFIAETTQYIK